MPIEIAVNNYGAREREYVMRKKIFLFARVSLSRLKKIKKNIFPSVG